MTLAIVRKVENKNVVTPFGADLLKPFVSAAAASADRAEIAEAGAAAAAEAASTGAVADAVAAITAQADRAETEADRSETEADIAAAAAAVVVAALPALEAADDALGARIDTEETDRIAQIAAVDTASQDRDDDLDDRITSEAFSLALAIVTGDDAEAAARASADNVNSAAIADERTDRSALIDDGSESGHNFYVYDLATGREWRVGWFASGTGALTVNGLSFFSDTAPDSRFIWEWKDAGGSTYHSMDRRGRMFALLDEDSLVFAAANMSLPGQIATADLPVIGDRKATYGFRGVSADLLTGAGYFGASLTYERKASGQIRALTSASVVAFLLAGQSNHMGGGGHFGAGITDSTYTAAHAWMMAGTPMKGSKSATWNPATATGLIPATESTNATAPGVGDEGNTPATMAMRSFARMFVLNGQEPPLMIALSHAVGGTAIENLTVGTTPFANGIAQAGKMQDLWEIDGHAALDAHVLWDQGETDRANGQSKATHRTYLNGLQDGYDAQIPTATGQTPLPLFIIIQLSGSSSTGGGEGDLGSAIGAGDIAQAQLEFALERPRATIAAPKYAFKFYDRFHRAKDGHDFAGEYEGKALYFMRRDGRFDFTVIKSAVRIGNTVVLTYRSRYALIRENEYLSQNANDGFIYRTATGDVAITKSEITGPKEVTLTLATTPTGGSETVRYAQDLSLSSAPSDQAVAWGNIAGADPTPSLTYPGRTLVDYAAVQIISVT